MIIKIIVLFINLLFVSLADYIIINKGLPDFEVAFCDPMLVASLLIRNGKNLRET